MSTFTLMLGDIRESGFDFGLKGYPIFDESYRDLLNKKILDHYEFYEIGLETEGMFKFALNRRMSEIMPYYNKLYLSEQIEFDPLSTMNFTENGVTTGEESTTTGNVSESITNTTNTSDTTNRTVTDTHNESSSNTASRARAVNSELPQVRLSGDEDYATSASDSTGDTTVTGTGDTDSTVTETGGTTGGADTTVNDTGTITGEGTTGGTLNRTMTGYQGAASVLLMQYRDALLNIDMQVISDLGNLFMGVWDNGDSFTGDRNYGYFYPTI